MQKTWIVMFSSLALILLLGILCSAYSQKTGREMRERIEEIANAMDGGKWENAQKLVDSLETLWEKKGKMLQMWVVHEDADEVTAEMAKLTVAVQERNVLFAKMICEELLQSVDHLYQRDAPRIKNIF